MAFLSYAHACESLWAFLPRSKTGDTLQNKSKGVESSKRKEQISKYISCNSFDEYANVNTTKKIRLSVQFSWAWNDVELLGLCESVYRASYDASLYAIVVLLFRVVLCVLYMTRKGGIKHAMKDSNIKYKN
eukprot:scaffold5249_cov86-Cylindrotheca_fusiformis.AAC.4